MKYLIILSILLVSCSRKSDAPRDYSNLPSDTQYIPSGSTVIDSWCDSDNSNCIYKTWIKWKFGNDCFLSRSLSTSQAVITKVECPE